MSGLFGIIDPAGDVSGFLSQVVEKLSLRSWYQANTWSAPEARLGLGRLGIGIFNAEPQPITSPDGDITLFMAGELYETDALYKRLVASGQTPRSRIAAEMALSAYQSFGPSFAKFLQGPFFIALYDRTRNTLLLTNDRYGLYPHFYAQQDGKLAFAPKVRGVLCAPFVQRNLNLVSVAEYMRFQQLLGEKTFHQDVKLFPYGSFARFELAQGQWTIERYWDWDSISENTQITFPEAVEEGSRILRQAVERLVGDDLRPGVFLSGGLDSRTIIGLMPPRTPAPISATFGAQGSRDVYYAEQIARTVGSRHLWFDLPNGHWVLENADLHLKLTEGFHSWIHMHGISMLPALREKMDYNLTGWDGGTVMGHSDHVNPTYTQPVDAITPLLESFRNFNQSYTWPGQLEGEEQLLYTPEYRQKFQGLAFESFRKEYQRFMKFPPRISAETFYVTNHCWRSTQNMVTTARSHMEVRFPFFDYDLIDFIYSLRPEIRGHQLLYRHIITRDLPRLSRIPYDKQEFLPSVNPLLHKTQALSVRLRRRLGLFPQRPTLYADYEHYLRHDLREWAEGILFDPRTEARGIFNKSFLRSLMDRHVSGRELWTIGKLAPIITFEMVMREYFD
ncbi:MAG: asparagine synthetase B [Anaerolineaceae bacterium]|nr:asparagine synthetase B [Anaerolineaceae bacterium]